MDRPGGLAYWSFRGAKQFACGPGDDSEEEGEGEDDDGELSPGGEAGDIGTGRDGEIQGDAQVDGGRLRLTGAVVDDEDVVAGLAHAEVERTGLGARGDGEKTVGEIGTQILQGGAGHESQTDGFGTGLHVEAGVDAGGILAQVDLDVLPLGRGHLVDLVHEFDGGGGGQQEEAGKGGHGTGRTGRRGTIRSMNDSMAQPGPWLVPMDAPGWKIGLSWVSSLLLCAVFLSSGLWKITDVQGWAVRMVEAKVPEPLGLAAALLVGIA